MLDCANMHQAFESGSQGLPSKYSSPPALKAWFTNSKAFHIVEEIDFAENVQLSIISKTSL